jgi:uncharacterized lipoprotein YehR (DUF1307 family)
MKTLTRLITLVFVLALVIGIAGCAQQEAEGPATVHVLAME